MIYSAFWLLSFKLSYFCLIINTLNETLYTLCHYVYVCLENNDIYINSNFFVLLVYTYNVLNIHNSLFEFITRVLKLTRFGNLAFEFLTYYILMDIHLSIYLSDNRAQSLNQLIYLKVDSPKETFILLNRFTVLRS